MRVGVDLWLLHPKYKALFSIAKRLRIHSWAHLYRTLFVLSIQNPKVYH